MCVLYGCNNVGGCGGDSLFRVISDPAKRCGWWNCCFWRAEIFLCLLLSYNWTSNKKSYICEFLKRITNYKFFNLQVLSKLLIKSSKLY